jgi:hypothetical protein
VTNAEIAEWLAGEAKRARPLMTRAFRRAARRAHLWPEEAATLIEQRRSLPELPGSGPYIEKVIVRWVEGPASNGWSVLQNPYKHWGIGASDGVRTRDPRCHRR